MTAAQAGAYLGAGANSRITGDSEAIGSNDYLGSEPDGRLRCGNQTQIVPQRYCRRLQAAHTQTFSEAAAEARGRTADGPDPLSGTKPGHIEGTRILHARALQLLAAAHETSEKIKHSNSVRGIDFRHSSIKVADLTMLFPPSTS